jgi:hypothetical protein
MARAPKDSLAPATGERRSNERFTMILRVGVLAQNGKTSYCLVRNVSASGVQVKLYTGSFTPGEVLFRVADEDPVGAEIAWIENGFAGIKFDDDIDPATLLRLQQKLTPVRRRSIPRIRASASAAIRISGRNIPAALCDISSIGAKVRSSRPLPVGGMAFVRFPDLPEVRAFVRWNAGSESGLVFETPIPMSVIATWIEGRLRVIP